MTYGYCTIIDCLGLLEASFFSEEKTSNGRPEKIFKEIVFFPHPPPPVLRDIWLLQVLESRSRRKTEV